MLAEIEEEVRSILGIDAISISSLSNMYIISISNLFETEKILKLALI